LIFDDNSVHSSNSGSNGLGTSVGHHDSFGGPNSGFTISSMPPSSGSSNQCFTISLAESNKNKQVGFDSGEDQLDKRTAVAVAAACLNDSFHAAQSAPSQNGPSNPTGGSNQTNSPTATLCD